MQCYENNFLQHVEEVNEKIANILMTEGPDGHPLRREAKETARKRWKKLAAVIKGAALFKVTRYSSSLLVTPRHSSSLLERDLFKDNNRQ